MQILIWHEILSLCVAATSALPLVWKQKEMFTRNWLSSGAKVLKQVR